MVLEKDLKFDGYDKKTGRPTFECGTKSISCSDVLLGQSPTGRLWGAIWEWCDLDKFTMSDISECAGISRTSLYKIWHDFTDNEWLIPSVYEKGVQYYRVNMHNFVVKGMVEIIDAFVMYNFEMSANTEEIKEKYYQKYKDKKIKSPTREYYAKLKREAKDRKRADKVLPEGTKDKA